MTFGFVEHFLMLKSAALFDKHFYKAKRVGNKGFSGKQFDKHCNSTVNCFIKALVVLSLINTAIVLWGDLLKFWRQKQTNKSNKRLLLLERWLSNVNGVLKAFLTIKGHFVT